MTGTLHPAYQAVQIACRAWTMTDDRAAAQAKVIVRDLFDAGMLAGEGYVLIAGRVVKPAEK